MPLPPTRTRFAQETDERSLDLWEAPNLTKRLRSKSLASPCGPMGSRAFTMAAFLP
jgi:hypothetical protein